MCSIKTSVAGPSCLTRSQAHVYARQMLSTQRMWCDVAAMQRSAAAATLSGSRLRSPSTCTRTPCRSMIPRSCALPDLHSHASTAQA
jgi:hypothetical protein